MARPFSITIPSATFPGSRRTVFAQQYLDVGEDPKIVFHRITSAPIKGIDDIVIDPKGRNHERNYSTVADETVEIHDAKGNPVTVSVAGIFEGCSKFFDAWAAEDGELLS